MTAASNKDDTNSVNLSRHVQTVVVAAFLGIGAWLVSGLNDIQRTMVRVDTTLSSVLKNAETSDRRYDSLQKDTMDNRIKISDMDRRIADLESHIENRGNFHK